MEHDLTRITPWYLVTIDDPDFLPGNKVRDMIQLMLNTKPFKFAVLSSVDCNEAKFMKNNLEDAPLELVKLLEMISSNTEFTWADFFLFLEYPIDWDNPENGSYPYLIEQTSTTIRVVDGQYFYIYTPYIDIVNAVSSKYVVESLRFDLLDNLDYPY